MSKTIGGFMLVKDAIKYDYCFEEAIRSLCVFCDQVFVIYVQSFDGTEKVLMDLQEELPNFQFVMAMEEDWGKEKGKEKLSKFQNIAISFLKTDYQFLCQADEIVDPKSIPAIRKAVEQGGEGYMCTRHNLWGSPYTVLDVPLNRMPCSPQVIRLTKNGLPTYDDGENIAAQASMEFVNDIVIWHMGFVRKQEVMKAKIINMQENIFEMGHDPKLDGSDLFNPELWFSGDDLKPIPTPLPDVIKQWAKERVY